MIKKSLNTLSCAALTLISVIAIGYIDYITGHHITLMIFYIIPVAFIAIALGNAAGITTAIICGIAWLAADLLSGHTCPGTAGSVWNTVLRIIFFLFPVYIIERKMTEKEIKKYRDNLEGMVNERTALLKENEEKYRGVVDNIGIGVALISPDMKILALNKQMKKWFPDIDAEQKPLCYRAFNNPPRESACPYCPTRLTLKDGNVHESATETPLGGKIINYRVISSPIKDAQGNVSAAVEMVEDITGRRQKDEEFRHYSEESYRSVFESANDAIIIRDIKTYKIVDINNRACEMFCYPKDEMIGLDLQAVIPGDQPHTLKNTWYYYDRAAQGEPQLFELPAKDKIGRTFWAEVSLRRAIIGNKYHLLAITRDITERKESQNKIIELNRALSNANEDLKHLALRDSHTGLYNHHYFVDAIEAEIGRAKRHSEELSVIMMDIDYFKSINDVYGHQFGDVILKQFAKLLKKEVRSYDMVIRFGGEEFIIISPNTGQQAALALAQRILDTVGIHNFGDKKHSVKIKVSAAVSSYPCDNSIGSGADFINIADQILNKAKEEGGNRVYSLADLKSVKDTAQPKEEPSADELKEKIKKLTARGNQSVVEAIFAFAKTIELKDRYTGEHVEKTIHYATGIAKHLGLEKHDIEIIKEASVLHDLGKIGIPEKILLKTGRLTRYEREVIKEHPQIGADIIRPLHFLRDIIPVVLHHHEWWNGKGYPNRLKKEAIPIGARIVAIADVYQALTSDRPYHKAYGKETAVRMIKGGSGTQFDPRIVDAFLGILEKG